MRLLAKELPEIPLVAAFETGFHETIPPASKYYAIRLNNPPIPTRRASYSRIKTSWPMSFGSRSRKAPTSVKRSRASEPSRSSNWSSALAI